ncbi:MAG: hypothetical protein H7124_08445 [Phycisphaerales bacterium]|nr:hypothetical protein [Hyphomonadaceae bacterium]
MAQSSQETQGAVLVLGMHRSGTSALTRGLEVLGIDLGRDLKAPVEGDNDKGFFEHATLSEINDQLLALHNGRWDSLFAHAVGEGSAPELGVLKLKALHEIERAFGRAPYFAFKDPRTSRTVPFWKDVLARAGVKTQYVIAFRNPMSVAESLEARDQFARERSYYLWLLHMLSAVQHTRGERRVFIEYDALLADPEAALRRIEALVDDPRVAVGAHALQVYQREFLDQGLRRHLNQASHLTLDVACSPFVQAVYALLQREAQNGALESDESDAAWAPHLAAFDALAPHLNYLDVLDRGLGQSVHQIALGRNEVAHLRDVIAERDARLMAAAAARDGDVANLRGELSELAAASAAQLAARDSDAANSRREASELHAAYTAELALRENDAINLRRQVSELDAALAARDERLVAAAAAEASYRAEIASLAEQAHEQQIAFAVAVSRAEQAASQELAAALVAVREAATDELAAALAHAAEAAAQDLAEAVARLEAAATNELAETERRYAIALDEVVHAEQQFAQQQIALAEERAAATQAQGRAEAERRFSEQLDSERQRFMRMLDTERAIGAREALEREHREGAARRAEAQRELEMAQRNAAEQFAGAAALRHAYESLAARLRAVYASSSWRFTRPMRALKSGVAGGEINETVPPAPETPAAPLHRTYTAPAAVPAAGPRRRVHFTICAKNYLPIARTCLQSSAHFHPDAEHYLVLCDEVDQGYDPASEGFTVIKVRDLPIPCFEDMALRYDVMELNTAIKPFCFTHFFAAGADEVVYLDPDLYFLSRMDAVREALAGDADAVLTPHITRPIEDDKHPNDIDMLRAGVYNLGFLALRRSADAQAFAAWWGERLRTMAVSDIQRGLFTDQKWCDLLPCFVPRTRVLNRPGYNLAYWNLMHRPVAKSGETWTAAGEPISFVHFSGASFTDANVFSKHQNRYDANSIGALRGLYDAYRDLVRENGMGSGPNYRYSFDYDAQGRRVAPVLRQLYRDEIAGDHPQVSPDAERIYSLANEPAPDVQRFAGPLVTRLMHRIWKSRPDLQAAFDLNSEAGQRGLEDWCRHTFAREYALDDRFHPLRGQTPEGASVTERAPAAAPAPMAMISRTVLSQASALRPIYRHLPASVRHRAKVMLTKSAYASRASGREDENVSEIRPGAALVGYARGELGMGEHVRMTAVSMQCEGVPIGIVNISEDVLARQEDRRFDHLHTSGADFRANIFHVNADQLPIVTSRLGETFLSGKTNIAYPAWELADFPREWTPQLNLMDEIWAPSLFIQEALTKCITAPVVHMPLAVEIAAGYDKWRREDFGLPNDAFVFLFYFDLASFSSRKNPMGVIEAYREATQGRAGAADRESRLVVKVISADRFPREFGHLQQMVASVPGVILIPEVFSADRIHGLVNCADAFVSLHRSEGFGRGPAEAMRLGRVAIATGFSGNMDYMNASNSFPVSFRMRAVGADEYPHGKGQYWAEPDIREAAAIMLRLIENPSLGREIGESARLHMETHHSCEAVGRRYAERLRVIGALE